MPIQVVLNNRGFDQLRTSKEMERILRQAAERLASRAGDGYVAERASGPHRGRWRVYTATVKARHAEATQHSLIRALGGG